MSLYREDERGRGAERSAWSRLDLVSIVTVTALAAALRFYRLAEPHRVIFDETYYAKDACWFATASRSLCGIESEQTQVHPPLGKWIISAGIHAFGYDSFGWRVSAAVAGSLTVALLYLLARRLLHSTLGAALASGLLAVDFLHFVQSRVAMLDVFTALFGVATVLFVVLDREQLADGGRRPGVSGRPWLFAAGVAAGAALATKWSGLLFVFTALVITVASEFGARRGSSRRGATVVRVAGPSIVLALVVVPALVYTATYAGLLDGEVFAAPWKQGAWLRALWDRQFFMLDFHRNLAVSHAYASPAWSWLLLKRPVSYYFETAANGDYMEVLAVGDPFVWWASLAALFYIFVRWLKRRGPGGAEGIILVAFGMNYLPWLVLTQGRSAVFLFYLVTAVPFMCLAVAYVPARFERVPGVPAATVGFCAIVLALFVFYYPVLASVPLEHDDWLARIWIFDECDRPPPTPSAGETAGTGASATQNPDDVPPTGWCWI